MNSTLYINDNNLLLRQGEKQVKTQGYAWLKGAEVHFDFNSAQTAISNCRMQPQQINSRYWQQCDESSVVNNDCGIRHSADLIWKHLGELANRFSLSELSLVVPAHYQKSNLQLLLGIAKACGLRVSALVNKAVLFVSEVASGDGEYLHVDIQLHQTVCSRITVEQGVCRVSSVDVLYDVSIHRIQDSLLKHIQALFIHDDRFDPLHDAATEQQLFDQLLSLGEQVGKQGKANACVQHLNRSHSINIDRKQWQEALQFINNRLTEVAKKVNQQCVYSYNGAEPLLLLNESEVSLPEMVVPEALFEQTANSENGVHYCEELPILNLTTKPQPLPEETKVAEQGDIKKKATEQTDAQRVTHLLHAGVAVPIDMAQITLIDNCLNLSQAQSTNLPELFEARQIYISSDVDRKVLRVNDRIASNLADGVALAINVIK